MHPSTIMNTRPSYASGISDLPLLGDTIPDNFDRRVSTVGGVPDVRYGEALCAWVKIREGAEPLTAERVREFATRNGSVKRRCSADD